MHADCGWWRPVGRVESRRDERRKDSRQGQEEGDESGVLVLDISSRIYVLNIVRDVMHSLHILV